MNPDTAPADLSVLVDAFGARCVLTDDDRRRPYEVPERGAPGHARAVLVPDTEADVQRALQLANMHGWHYVLSGGRTGLVESQRPQGEIVLSLEKLRAVLAFTLADGRGCAFDRRATQDDVREHLFAWWTGLGRPTLEGSSVTVEAGLAVDALNEILAPLGRMFPMEMGSSASASLGACVANASAGANAVCYGTAAHMAQAAWGFHGDGSPAGPEAAPSWQRPPPDVLAIDSTRLPAEWGLVGSQGVFGVITRVQLRTQPVPQTREGALLAVAGMPQAMRIFGLAREIFGANIEEFEFLSRSAVELVLRRKGADVRLPFEQTPDAPYLVLMQIKSDTADEDLAQKLYAFCSEIAGLPDEAIGYAPLPALKKIRHSVTEASNLEMRALGGGRLSFDTATPVDRFGDYLAQLAQDLRAARPDVQLVDFGHAGVGGAHLHLIGGAGSPVAPDAERLTRIVFDVTQRFGGTFSAEHGVGPKWADEFLRRTAPARLEELAARKRREDPRNVLSPRSFGFDRLLAGD
ncbi:MAG: D-2-hydroxyglutarate dehydrogenase [Panacagrimonas sp.]|jgi:FAD/FMN-containing dehydrogenase|nr:FAD-binding oxidoreductase [Panacagrimonas sp.]MCC2658289.1 D-2-hydroxyglutarate dehydrogenase [Panacagrimonas sp.]